MALRKSACNLLQGFLNGLRGTVSAGAPDAPRHAVMRPLAHMVRPECSATARRLLVVRVVNVWNAIDTHFC